LSLSEQCGGKDIYLPKGISIDNAIRNSEIYHQRQSLGAQETAERYQLSIRQISTIVKEQHALRSQGYPCDQAKWPTTLVRLYDCLLNAIETSNIDLDTPTRQETAKDMVLALAVYFGGRDIYLPKGVKIKQALRNNEIFSQAGKVSPTILAARYDLSNRRINRIIEDMYKARRVELRRSRELH
ncbi:Mor transcription activator family protein, partial [Thaumasiovibrio sp. DFM-14]|uniref:Mor transcription activator family protein n=1 Tax=Thaumasiovibrio sp. DFM-14 TaxID=3384792 RepID=UPI0039A1979E